VLANAGTMDIAGDSFGAAMAGIATPVLVVTLVPLVVLAALAVVANLVQHRPLLSLDPLKPKLDRISPIAGAKRLFSSEALVNFAKGLVKLAVVGAAIFLVLWPERDRLDTMMSSDPLVIVTEVQDLAIKMFIPVLAVLTVIAGADFFYQRHKWWTRQMMSVRDVRDEYKQMEGDPQIKARIRQLRGERGRRRMLAQVPDATVVITNPTHYAVALKYDRAMSAPKCLAKGADAVALRIREAAREHDVPIVENAPLARALFAAVEVDETIPTEHFKAVAQVIGYVMRLKDRPGWRSSARPDRG